MITHMPQAGDIWQNSGVLGTYTFLVYSVRDRIDNRICHFDAFVFNDGRDVKNLTWMSDFDGWTKLA